MKHLHSYPKDNLQLSEASNSVASSDQTVILPADGLVVK